MKPRVGWILVVAATGVPAAGRAQSDYMGARSVLMRMLAPPGGSALLNPRVLFCNDLEEFASNLATLPPDRAAHAWLELVRRASELDGEDKDFGSQLTLQTLKVLPPPESWPTVSRSLAEAGPSDRTNALQLLFDVLAGNDASALERLKVMPENETSAWYKNSIRLELAVRMRDADAIEEIVKHEADEIRLKPPLTMRSGPSMRLPNLVPLLGAKRAEKVIAYVLFTAKAELIRSPWDVGMGGGDKATRDLARKIAKANVERLAWPQWSLATGPEGGDLYVRMVRRFPKVNIGSAYDSPPSWSTMQGAAVSCLVNLCASGLVERARAFGVANRESLSLGWGFRADGSLAEELRRFGKLGNFLRLLDELSRRYPDTALPDLYLTFAKDNQPLAATEVFLRRLVASKLKDYRKQNALLGLQNILLQEGKLAEAAKILLSIGKDEGGFTSDSRANLLQALGKELHRPDLTRRELAANESAFRSGSIYRFGDIALLVQQGKGPQVEEVLIRDLRDSLANKGDSIPPAGQTAGLALAQFYFKIGRYRDVVTLFEKFLGWQSPDIQFVDQLGAEDLVMLAKSLASVGRKQDALRVDRFALTQADPSDAAYELLLAHDPPGALAFLEELIHERPRDSRLLKWQAVCLLRSHRLSEAEAVVRRAFGLEPAENTWDLSSKDFVAYRVLASILTAQGRTVEAGRLGSYAIAAGYQAKAAAFDEVEMRQLAISEYRKAVKLLPDDFILRLKLGLDEFHFGSVVQGKADIVEAFKHVPPASGVSERMLTAEELSNPDLLRIVRDELRAQASRGTKNAMVYSCLAAIDSSGGDISGAIENLMRALALDPDCLTAWTNLQVLSDWLPLKIRKQVSMALIRLREEVSPYADRDVPDYRAAWLGQAEKVRRPSPGMRDVFVLRASRSLLERTDDQEFVRSRASGLAARLSSTPGAYIAQDPVIKAISMAINSSR